MDKLQMLHNGAARVVADVKFEDADHDALLNDLGWLSIRNVIKLDMGVFVYKTVEGQASKMVTSLIHKFNNLHRDNTRLAAAGNLPFVRTNLFLINRAIAYSGVKCWNAVP